MAMRKEAGDALLKLAREAVQAHLEHRPPPSPAPLGADFERPAGVFVTLRCADGQLRGCIGAPSATQPTLAQELVRIAPLAATSDPRFPPITLTELPKLRFEVSVLGLMSSVTDIQTLDPFRFGITVRDAHGRGALLLPNIPGVDTVEVQLNAIRHKAGIPENLPIVIERFEVEKCAE